MTDIQENKINPKFRRFIKYLEYKDIALRKAEEMLLSGNGRLGKMKANNTEIKDSFKEKLLHTFSDLSRSWLENGEGEMIIPDVKENARSIGDILHPDDPQTSPFIDLGDGQYLMVVPLVNEYAYAGYLSGYKDPEYLEVLPKHTIIVDKHHKGKYRAFEIVGDSMDNNTNESISDGSIATGREIQHHLWTSKFHTHRYKDYVIVHKKLGIVAKRIIKHDTDNGVITCHSLNPDKNEYPDFDLNLDDIKQMFNIVNVLQKR